VLKKNGDAVAGAAIANPEIAAATETAAMDNFMASSKVVASNPGRLTIAVAAAMNEQIASIPKSRPLLMSATSTHFGYAAALDIYLRYMKTHLRNRSRHFGLA
jgi:hypothetical protein